MATTPKYRIDDVVYLNASAKLGFLESYRVSSIHQVTATKWVYRIAITQFAPATFTNEDAVSYKNITNLYFDEGELLSYCEASSEQIASLERKLNAAVAARIGKCS